LLQQIKVAEGENKFPINVGAYAAGIYSIKVTYNGYTRIVRLVVN
jgi:hypothetical protein